MVFFVLCPACDEDHSVEEVESLNIEENAMGEDLLTFRCIDRHNTKEQSLWKRYSLVLEYSCWLIVSLD